MTSYYWGRRENVPCKCGDVSLFCASLIPQPWMQSADHLPATDCNCGSHYYSWSKSQVYEQKTKQPR